MCACTRAIGYWRDWTHVSCARCSSTVTLSLFFCLKNSHFSDSHENANVLIITDHFSHSCYQILGRTHLKMTSLAWLTVLDQGGHGTIQVSGVTTSGRWGSRRQERLSLPAFSTSLPFSPGLLTSWQQPHSVRPLWECQEEPLILF